MMVAPPMEDLLLLDSAEILARRTTSGVPVWTLMRWDVLMALMRVLYYESRDELVPRHYARNLLPLASQSLENARLLRAAGRAKVVVIGDTAVRMLGSGT